MAKIQLILINEFKMRFLNPFLKSQIAWRLNISYFLGNTITKQYKMEASSTHERWLGFIYFTLEAQENRDVIDGEFHCAKFPMCGDMHEGPYCQERCR